MVSPRKLMFKRPDFSVVYRQGVLYRKKSQVVMGKGFGVVGLAVWSRVR